MKRFWKVIGVLIILLVAFGVTTAFANGGDTIIETRRGFLTWHGWNWTEWKEVESCTEGWESTGWNHTWYRQCRTVKPEPKKVYVCKYVGTPDFDEVLQTGNNPIEVSINAIHGWDGVTIPAWFADGQNRSLVMGYVGAGFPVITIEDCPTPSVYETCKPENTNKEYSDWSDWVAGTPTYGEWVDTGSEMKRFVRTPYTRTRTVEVVDNNPLVEEPCDSYVETGHRGLISFETKDYEQCGRCSNKFVGWVTWVDRDGGCNDDFYNERVEYPYNIGAPEDADNCYADECAVENQVSLGKVYSDLFNVGDPVWGDWQNPLNGKTFRYGTQYIASDWTEEFEDKNTGAYCWTDKGRTEGETELYEEECSPRWTGRYLQTYERSKEDIGLLGVTYMFHRLMK